jgi:hypothetical protein
MEKDEKMNRILLSMVHAAQSGNYTYDAIYGNKSLINYSGFQIYKTKQVDILIMVSGAFAKDNGHLNSGTE